jgi:chemotaxis protein histidine kinase CheA
VARLSAKDNATRVDMQIADGQVDMGRGVIDRVAAPLEHLLRNAIVHGIEAPAVRVVAGGSEAGKGTPITIHLPLTLSVLQAVVMRLGSASYTVPTVMAGQVQRPKTNVLVATRSAMMVEWQVVTYPSSPLATRLGMMEGDSGAIYKRRLCRVCREGWRVGAGENA